MSGQDDLNCGLIPLNTNTFSLDNGSYFCLNPENHQFDKGLHNFLPTHVPVEGLRYGGAGVYLVVLYCLRGVFCSIAYHCKASEPALLEQHACKEKTTCAHDVWHKKNASERISTTSTLLAENRFVRLWTHGICRVKVLSFLCQTSASRPNDPPAKWEHTSLKPLALSSSDYLKAGLEMHETSTSR